MTHQKLLDLLNPGQSRLFFVSLHQIDDGKIPFLVAVMSVVMCCLFVCFIYSSVGTSFYCDDN